MIYLKQQKRWIMAKIEKRVKGKFSVILKKLRAR